MIQAADSNDDEAKKAPQKWHKTTHSVLNLCYLEERRRFQGPIVIILLFRKSVESYSSLEVHGMTFPHAFLMADSNSKHHNSLQSICYKRGSLQLLDQRKLPLGTVYLEIKGIEERRDIFMN